ncbi:MAG: DUF933 domain-containing protein [Candidatus Omnitrophota bacterium]
MKISCLGVDIENGKIKYQDERLVKLTEKFDPKKISPFFAEFVGENFSGSDCIIVARDKILDFLIMDMEKVDTRMNNTKDEAEKKIWQKLQQYLEKEVPVCDIEFNAEEFSKVKELAPLSLKPTLVVEGEIEINDLIIQAFSKSGMMFFYTAGKKEVRSWPVKKNSDIITCAGKIHSDLARGFIKAEIINFKDFINFHNMQEAKANGLVKLVDRDYIVQEGDIIDIRFNV